MDDDARARRPDIILGEPLDRLSIDDLEDRIIRLKAEIERAETALASRKSSRDHAENFFKR